MGQMGGSQADTEAVDKVLLARAQGGNADAFCELVEPLQSRLLRQATALWGEPAGAEDLVQQTLVEGWRSVARYDGRCRLSTWLYAILVHRHYKAVRAAATRPVPFARLAQADQAASEQRLLDLATESPSPVEAVGQREEQERLRGCLAALPPPHRQVILLRFFDDASLAEIAAAMNCSVGTVKSRLHYALERLREMNLSDPARDTPS
jgi:RNA polymerase sigma-70 factor (ECF subfamily)